MSDCNCYGRNNTIKTHYYYCKDCCYEKRKSKHKECKCYDCYERKKSKHKECNCNDCYDRKKSKHNECNCNDCYDRKKQCHCVDDNINEKKDNDIIIIINNKNL